MEFTIISVLVFASITTCLVLLLNLAEKKLLPQGDVSILINDEPDKALSVGTGGTLLGALSGQKVFLPSACGGGGTCVQCTCQVMSGGGSILPTVGAHTGTIGNVRLQVCELCVVPVTTEVEEDALVAVINRMDFTIDICTLSGVFLTNQVPAFE